MNCMFCDNMNLACNGLYKYCIVCHTSYLDNKIIAYKKIDKYCYDLNSSITLYKNSTCFICWTYNDLWYEFKCDSHPEDCDVNKFVEKQIKAQILR